MESGGEDAYGIIKEIEKSTNFFTRTGVERWLHPFCLAYYGHPVNGLIAFRETLMEKRNNNDRKASKNDFYSKCLEMEAEDPVAYVKQRKHQIMFVNLGAGSGMLTSRYGLSPSPPPHISMIGTARRSFFMLTMRFRQTPQASR